MENDLDMALCEMTKQRDDLLAALKLCRFDSLNMSIDDMRSISEAIKNAELSK